MAWTLLITLLTLCSGDWLGEVFVDPGGFHVGVCGTVTPTCTGNSNHVGTCYVGWCQQIYHGAPKTVMLRATRPSGIPAWFPGSSSGYTTSLTISGLQPEDEADYYCSAWHNSINKDTVLQDHGDLRQKPAPVPHGHPYDCVTNMETVENLKGLSVLLKGQKQLYRESGSNFLLCFFFPLKPKQM
ncbi:unnamed protein product [Gulo gulo]|uniref:Immunoglobulin V-set domain-containing protein n=1 Tax=Gulo gulo TaxID=48420 RepID=A0A9X9LN14_GULGU|nr:unnamed protein product [Gulo gulo]